MGSFSQPETTKEHLIDQARLLLEEAKLLPPGAVRDATIRAARQAEIGAYMSEWLASPGCNRQIDVGLICMAQMRATRETMLLAASVAWCFVLACSLLYLILIAAL